MAMASTDSALSPLGAASSAALRADSHSAAGGQRRAEFGAGHTALAAPSAIELDAPALRLVGGAEFAEGGAVLAAAAIAGGTELSDASAPAVAAAAAAVRSLEASGTLTVSAARLTLDADVRIAGTLDTAAVDQLGALDATLRLGDAGGDGADELEDATRDGAGITVAGAPRGLPAGAEPALFEHSLRWRASGGDFRDGGQREPPQLRPVWDARGGGVCIAGPDAAARAARFSFVPTFTVDEARLDIFYSAGGAATLLASFTAEPLSGEAEYEMRSPAPGVSYDPDADALTYESGGVVHALLPPRAAAAMLAAAAASGSAFGAADAGSAGRLVEHGGAAALEWDSGVAATSLAAARAWQLRAVAPGVAYGGPGGALSLARGSGGALPLLPPDDALALLRGAVSLEAPPSAAAGGGRYSYERWDGGVALAWRSDAPRSAVQGAAGGWRMRGGADSLEYDGATDTLTLRRGDATRVPLPAPGFALAQLTGPAPAGSVRGVAADAAGGFALWQGAAPAPASVALTAGAPGGGVALEFAA